MTREQVDDLARIEKEAIQRYISKTGRTKTANGYRYQVRPAHGFICWPEEVPDDAIPEATVTVEQRATYETIQNRTAIYFRHVRRFNVDLLQLRGLKQVPAIANA